MVEWLSQHILHRPFVNCGGATESRGLTFREQDEAEKKEKMENKKKAIKKRKTIDSKIGKALDLLREAILLEMNELVEKHKEKCRQCKLSKP